MREQPGLVDVWPYSLPYLRPSQPLRRFGRPTDRAIPERLPMTPNERLSNAKRRSHLGYTWSAQTASY